MKPSVKGLRDNLPNIQIKDEYSYLKDKAYECSRKKPDNLQGYHCHMRTRIIKLRTKVL